MLITKDNIKDFAGHTVFHVNPYGVTLDNLYVTGYLVQNISIDKVNYQVYLDSIKGYWSTSQYLKDMFTGDKKTYSTLLEASEYVNQIKRNGFTQDVIDHNIFCERFLKYW